MNCSSCGKYHDGYRCPYCGTFELETEEGAKRKGSLYKKHRIRAGRSQWPAYIFLILFVGGWLTIVSIAVFSGNVGETMVITDIGSSGFGNVAGFEGTPVSNTEYFTITPKSLKVNKDGDVIAVVSVENTSSAMVGMSVYAVTKMSGAVEYTVDMEDGPTVVFEPGEKKKVTVIVRATELDAHEVTDLTTPRFRYHTYIYGDNMNAEQLEGVQAFSINGKIER